MHDQPTSANGPLDRSATPPSPPHPLLEYLTAAAAGRFPAADGEVTFVDPLDDGRCAVVAFTGHAVIAGAVSPTEVLRLGADGFGGASHPAVLSHLAAGGQIGALDVTLVARGRGELHGDDRLPETESWDDHPRVRYARSLRTDVRVYGDRDGFVTLASGLAGRLEMSLAVADGSAGSGSGRGYIRAALALADADTDVFAAVAPGNARSLRAFLREGFTPLGSEVIITPGAGFPADGQPVG